MGRRSSTRVDEGKKGCSLLAIKQEARTVPGRGEKSLLSGPGSELHLGREKERKKKYEDNRRDEQKKTKTKSLGFTCCKESHPTVTAKRLRQVAFLKSVETIG